METLPFGSITDVTGIRVGHFERVNRHWQTGTTVVFAPDGAAPGVDVRGGGPGTRETEAIAQENLVQRVHAICLSGGSAFGLSAADGVMALLEDRGLGVPVGDAGVVPVVPAAVIFDLGRGGAGRYRPTPDFGERALRNARVRQKRWGAVGAAAGARAGGIQGGVGTASTSVLVNGVSLRVGALAVVNAAGSTTDPTTGLPWETAGLRLKRPIRDERRTLERLRLAPAAPSLNTTIGVVATDASLSKSEVAKMAAVAHDGLARAIRPAHSMFDGDTVFGLATGVHPMPNDEGSFGDVASRAGILNQLLVAGADMFAAACTHAVLSARSHGDVPGYFDVCASIDPFGR